MRRALIFFFFLLVVIVEAVNGTTYTTDGSAAGVQNAINTANTGDIIQIPNGSYTWTTGINITKAVTVTGQTKGLVTITDNVNGDMIDVTPSAAGSIVISNLVINEGSVGTRNLQRFLYCNYAGFGTTPVLVHDNTFTIIPNSNLYVLITWAQNGGVIWNNVFNGNNNTVKITNVQAAIQLKYPAVDRWATLDSMGMAGDPNGVLNTYIEYNTFNNFYENCIDCDDGSRTVFRENICNVSPIASHGYDTSPIGNRHWEIYKNHFNYPYATSDPNAPNMANAHIVMRGGTGVIYDNVLQPFNSQNWGNNGGLGRTAFNWLSDAVTQVRCYTVYPIPRALGQGWNGGSGTYSESEPWGGPPTGTDQWSTNVGYFSDPVYVWSNTVDTTYQPDLNNNTNNYGWNNNTSCNNGLTTQDFIQVNRDFFYSQDSTAAKPGWTPYTDPHPLALPGATPTPTGGAPAPAAPTNLRIVQ